MILERPVRGENETKEEFEKRLEDFNIYLCAEVANAVELIDVFYDTVKAYAEHMHINLPKEILKPEAKGIHNWGVFLMTIKEKKENT